MIFFSPFFCKIHLIVNWDQRRQWWQHWDWVWFMSKGTLHSLKHHLLLQSCHILYILLKLPVHFRRAQAGLQCSATILDLLEEQVFDCFGPFFIDAFKYLV